MCRCVLLVASRIGVFFRRVCCLAVAEQLQSRRNFPPQGSLRIFRPHTDQLPAACFAYGRMAYGESDLYRITRALTGEVRDAQHLHIVNDRPCISDTMS